MNFYRKPFRPVGSSLPKKARLFKTSCLYLIQPGFPFEKGSGRYVRPCSGMRVQKIIPVVGAATTKSEGKTYNGVPLSVNTSKGRNGPLVLCLLAGRAKGRALLPTAAVIFMRTSTTGKSSFGSIYHHRPNCGSRLLKFVA